MHSSHLLGFIILIWLIQAITITKTCSIMKLTTPEELVKQAYAIVRAKAVNYETTSTSDLRSNGISSVIKFKVEEIIKSHGNISSTLLIRGYLTQNDDFNDHSPPYNLVRPNGRSGSCFAYAYKQNANFLLFLNNEYTPYWDPVTPVNEQLHSPFIKDKWLQWVKKQVARSANERILDQVFVSGAKQLRLYFL